MKKRSISNHVRICAAILAMTMGIALFPKTSGLSVLRADTTSKNSTNTNLGTSGISSPLSPEDKDTPWKGSYVWFGNYNHNPIKFRVLAPQETSFGEKTMFLDCDTILYKAAFDKTAPKNKDWDNSEIRSELNGDFYSESFSVPEQNAIATSQFSSAALPSGSFEEYEFHNTTALNDKIFLLDVSDVMNPSYGYSPDTGWEASANANSNGYRWFDYHNVGNHYKYIKGGTVSKWWLRSAYFGQVDNVGSIETDGRIDTTSIGFSLGVSPALNIKLDSILFNTYINRPDSSGAGGDYKLTLIDEDISLQVPTAYMDPSGSIRVHFKMTGDHADNVNQMSFLVLDKEYTPGNANDANILYYYSFTHSDHFYEGCYEFKTPDAIADLTCGKDYWAYFVAEEYATYDDNMSHHLSDYACLPAEISFAPLNVTVDLSKETVLSSSPYDLIVGDMISVDFYRRQLASIRYVQSPTLIKMYVDLDKDGSEDFVGYDVGDIMFELLPTFSISGTYAIPVESLPPGYESITFIFPLKQPVITKTEPTDNGVQIKWESAYGYDKYNVYRSDSLNGNYSYLASVTGGTLKYVDKTAQGGKTYYYKVRPYTKEDGKTIYGKYSDAAKVTVLPDLKLTVAPKSGVTMTLSWTAVSGAQSYEIYRATSAGGPYTYVKATTGTSTSDTGLHAGTRYYYMVRAKKTVSGTAQYSKYAAGVAVALATPSMESATFKSGKGVTLNWTKASGADRYNVYRYNTSTGKYDYVASVLGGTLTYTDASGKKGDYYKVRAYKRVDGVVYYGGWSNAKAGK